MNIIENDPEAITEANKRWRQHKRAVKNMFYQITGRKFSKTFNSKERMNQYYCARRTKMTEWPTRMKWN